MNVKEKLLAEKTRIEKEIALLDKKSLKPKLPQRSFDSLQKEFKELTAYSSYDIIVNGIEISFNLCWSGRLCNFELEDEIYTENVELADRNNDKGFNELVEFVYDNAEAELTYFLEERIQLSREYVKFRNRLQKLLVRVKKASDKYNFELHDLDS